jgi:drug/metabolite transporter (DMT)-like permease
MEITIACAAAEPLTLPVFGKQSNGAIITTLLLTVFLWGASNAATKYVVGAWPPGWTGATRLFCGGLILLAILKWTRWMGKLTPLTPKLSRDLWLRGALGLAMYIEAFNWALHYTAAAHVALYLGMSPMWALVWDEPPTLTWRSAQRYAAASMALLGVVVLFWPSLRTGSSLWVGELLGFTASVLWANFGRQCRVLGKSLSGAEVSAHTMFRGGIWLMPVAAYELMTSKLIWRADLVLLQAYTFIGGGVIAYALWNNALRHWPTSRVFLFNNLIPISTMAWARVCLKEPVTPTFWVAMGLVVIGVALGQARWPKVLGARWQPME